MTPFMTSTEGIPEKKGIVSGNSLSGTSSEVIEEPTWALIRIRFGSPWHSKNNKCIII